MLGGYRCNITAFATKLSKSNTCTFKVTLSPNLNFSYIKDINFLNTIHKVKIGFKPSFSSKIADLAENVRLKRPEKQAIVSCSEINHITPIQGGVGS